MPGNVPGSSPDPPRRRKKAEKTLDPGNEVGMLSTGIPAYCGAFSAAVTHKSPEKNGFNMANLCSNSRILFFWCHNDLCEQGTIDLFLIFQN